MKGVPVRIEVGPRDLERGEVTLVTRHNREKQQVKLSDVQTLMPTLLENMHQSLYQNAVKQMQENTYEAKTYDEFKDFIKRGGYVAMSIADEEAEIQIKKDTTATARVIPFDQKLITDTCPVTGRKAQQTIWFARAY
jgi:prolyl-tRNA synthetase